MMNGDKGPTDKMIKFEDTASYLTPCYHVAKDCNTNIKHNATEISNTSGGGAQV